MIERTRAVPTTLGSESGAAPPDPVGQNIETIAALHAQAEQSVSRHQRAAENVTAALGRPVFLYLILVVVSLWVLTNVFAARLGIPRFDPPPFYWLQGMVGLGALLMTIVVLITQNRQGKLNQQRAQLDLQVNLLAEQKVAKLIALVEELRRDLPIVHDRSDPEAEALKRPADPHMVAAVLEEKLEQAVEDMGTESVE